MKSDFGFELSFVKIYCGSFNQSIVKKLIKMFLLLVLICSQGRMKVKITWKNIFGLKIVKVLDMIPYFFFVVGHGKWGYLAMKNLEKP